VCKLQPAKAMAEIVKVSAIKVNKDASYFIEILWVTKDTELYLCRNIQ